MGIGASYEIMLVKMKKYRQFTPKRDFGSTFTKKVEWKNMFNRLTLDTGIRRYDKAF